MRIVGMIPARLDSTRFPGKVLALLEDRPLFWHVYNAAVSSGVFDAVYVASGHESIREACGEYQIPCLTTRTGHQNPTSRICEAAGLVDADLYVMIGADEPLLTPDDIGIVTEKAVTAMTIRDAGEIPFVVNAMAVISSAPEVFDSANIKIVCSGSGKGLYASRSPIPYPKGSLDYQYKKFVSIGAYTKEALNFFESACKGRLEQIEEFDLLRFMENGKTVLFVEIPGTTLSVDTPKDLERVRKQFAARENHSL